MKTCAVLAGIVMVQCTTLPAEAKSKVQWIDRQDALHLADNQFDTFLVASCATVPEATWVWAYCAWRKQNCDDNYAWIPRGYFDCKTNDANGNCTIEAQIYFRDNYTGAAVSLVDKKLVTEESVNVQCEDPVVAELLRKEETRRLVRRVSFDDLPGNGTLGNYTQEGAARFKVEYATDPLLPGYQRVETEVTRKKDVRIAYEGRLHKWIVWQVLRSKPAPASATHIGKRYCRASGAARELYECRQSAGAQTTTMTLGGAGSEAGESSTAINVADDLSVKTGLLLPGTPVPVEPVPAPEPADEPGYVWQKIDVLPSDVRYMSVAQ